MSGGDSTLANKCLEFCQVLENFLVEAPWPPLPPPTRKYPQPPVPAKPNMLYSRERFVDMVCWTVGQGPALFPEQLKKEQLELTVLKQGAKQQQITLSFRLEGPKESEMNAKCKQPPPLFENVQKVNKGPLLLFVAHL